MQAVSEVFKLIVSVVKQTEPFKWETQAVHAKMDSTNLLKSVTHAIPLVENVLVFKPIAHHVIQP